jgi:hypothetical protein
MKSIIFLLIAALFSGCVSTGDTAIRPVAFVLEKEITWSARALMGEETYFFPPGVYMATYRDSEGRYLIPPQEKFVARFKSGKTSDIRGGIYLPDDPQKGINVFTYDQGYTTAVNGMVLSKPPSGKMVRLRSWGPPDLVSQFKQTEL